ncbi:MAG: aminodeoxychorismate synthase component I [Pseudomonadota bacterium]
MFSNTVILKSNLDGLEGWLCFKDPVEILSTNTLAEVDQVLTDLQSRVDNGFYVAGYVSYEAASAIDPQFQVNAATDQPLCWFGVYKTYKVLGALTQNASAFAGNGHSFTHIGAVESSVGVDEYIDTIAEIKRQISYGNTYQVNYTLRLNAQYEGDSWSLFTALESMQNGGYAAYVDTESHAICSASPELFFTMKDGVLRTRPMKGTVKKGLNSEENARNKNWLASSAKNRAENVMIVDMIRNDIGQFAHPGSVSVDQLFSIEEYPTVYQMTSSVSARCYVKPLAAFRKMFPCASITGAPKVKTMEIIRNLECSPRGVYTGSIGFVTPDNSAQFNVAIRTAVIDKRNSSLEYGVGGGIVWDSGALDEFKECQAKSAILKNLSQPDNLLETILWAPDCGLYLLDLHMERLSRSAKALGYHFSEKYFENVISELNLQQYKNPMRVRVELWQDGELRCEVVPLNSMVGNVVGFAQSEHRNGSASTHKMTRRALYHSALNAHPEFQDLILCSPDGNITESCFANVVVKIGGEFCTPPLRSGLIAGVFRKLLRDAGLLREREISRQELTAANEVYLINSVRGWMKLQPQLDNLSYRVVTEFVYELPQASVVKAEIA